MEDIKNPNTGDTTPLSEKFDYSKRIMKIYKSNTNQVFDLENTNSLEVKKN